MVILLLFFLTLSFYPYNFKTKEEFAPILWSALNDVNFRQKDKFTHVILSLFYFALCVFVFYQHMLGYCLEILHKKYFS